MLKSALAAALIVGAVPSTAFSKSGATQYYFDSTGGNSYCDGLLLSATGRKLKGTHNSPGDVCTEGDQAGGFYTDGFSSNAMGSYDTVTPKTKLASITTEDEPNGGTNFEIVFNLDIKNRKWAVFVVAGGATPVNGGPLGVGKNAHARIKLNRPAFQK